LIFNGSTKLCFTGGKECNDFDMINFIKAVSKGYKPESFTICSLTFNINCAKIYLKLINLVGFLRTFCADSRKHEAIIVKEEVCQYGF